MIGGPNDFCSGKGKELVKRVLNKVFTNGTLMDGEYLNDEEAGHCISIRVRYSCHYICFVSNLKLGGRREQVWHRDS
jgi:DNA mismatch repair ATPase MutS